jgi:hypothetical protein
LTQFFGLAALPLLVNSFASTDETQAAVRLEPSTFPSQWHKNIQI